MLLTIHNLPSTTRYSDVKTLIQTRCGLSEILLDNLVNEGQYKKVTLGVAEEEDAAIVVRQINGLYVNGAQLYVEKVRQKKASEQPYRVRNQGNSPNNSMDQSGLENMNALPNIPMALNLAMPHMSYNQQAIIQDPMMQMMLAQQMIGMCMMPQQQNAFMDNSRQAPTQQPSSSQHNTQNYGPSSSNMYSASKKRDRSKNKKSQNWGGVDDQLNRLDEGFNRPYEQGNNPYNFDRRNQEPDYPNEDENRYNPDERDRPYQEFNRSDEEHDQNYDNYQGNQRPWDSDCNQPRDRPAKSSRWQPVDYQQDMPSRNRSRSPHATGSRNAYNDPTPQRYDSGPNNTNQSRGFNENQREFEGTNRYDQAPNRINTEPKENWNRRNTQPENQSRLSRRDISPHQNRLQAALKYYEPAQQSFSQNDSDSPHHTQAWESRKRPYPDSSVNDNPQQTRRQPTKASFGNNSQPFINRDNSSRPPATKAPPQRPPPNMASKRQKIQPPATRNAPPRGIPPLMSVAPARGMAPLIAPVRGIAPLLANPPHVPPRPNAPLNINLPPWQNAPLRPKSVKNKSYETIIRRDATYRRQAAARIGREILEKHQPPSIVATVSAMPESIYKLFRALKVAVFTRIELILSGELDIQIPQIIERYRKRFSMKEDDALYTAVAKDFEDDASKKKDSTETDDAGPAVQDVQVRKEVSEVVEGKNEMPVPKQGNNVKNEMPVPKQGNNVKNEMPVPKQGNNVKNEMPVPKQGNNVKNEMPVPKQENIVKNEMPVPKQDNIVKKEMPVPKQESIVKNEMPVPKQDNIISQVESDKLPNQLQKDKPTLTAEKPQPEVVIKYTYTASNKCDATTQKELENELKAIGRVFIAQCTTTSGNLEDVAIVDQLASHTVHSFKNSLRTSLTKRILGIDIAPPPKGIGIAPPRKGYDIRLFISGRIPDLPQMRKFLRPYGVRSVRQADKMLGPRPSFEATCVDLQSYEELCARGSAVLNPHTTLLFKPLVAPPSKSKPKPKPKKKNRKKYAGGNLNVKKNNEVFYVDIPEVKPKQEAKLNDVNTNIPDKKQDFFMMGGEEYKVEDEVFDVKDDDLVDY